MDATKPTRDPKTYIGIDVQDAMDALVMVVGHARALGLDVRVAYDQGTVAGRSLGLRLTLNKLPALPFRVLPPEGSSEAQERWCAPECGRLPLPQAGAPPTPPIQPRSSPRLLSQSVQWALGELDQAARPEERGS